MRFNLYKTLDNCSDNFSLPVYEIIKGSLPSPACKGLSLGTMQALFHTTRFEGYEGRWSPVVPCDQALWKAVPMPRQGVQQSPPVGKHLCGIAVDAVPPSRADTAGSKRNAGAIRELMEQNLYFTLPVSALEYWGEKRAVK